MPNSEHVGLEPDAVAADDDTDGSSNDFYEIFRVVCPDCGQPIALLEGEDILPEHARTTPSNPFGLTVCEGSGSPVTGAAHTDAALGARERDAAALLTLPEGLDWRRQPFSHAGGPGDAGPVRVRVPRMRRR